MARIILVAMLFGFVSLVAMPAAPAVAQAYYWDRASSQWHYDARAHKPRAARSAAARSQRIASGPDAMYRSCRRQVRRAVGIVPGTRMRLPRAYNQFIDRCIANGGVYS